jgi:hypothetical protein
LPILKDGGSLVGRAIDFSSRFIEPSTVTLAPQLSDPGLQSAQRNDRPISCVVLAHLISSHLLLTSVVVGFLLSMHLFVRREQIEMTDKIKNS